MNHRIVPAGTARAYQRAFQRLDASLENGDEGCNAEKLEILGRQMFGELWQARDNQATRLAEMKTS